MKRHNSHQTSPAGGAKAPDTPTQKHQNTCPPLIPPLGGLLLATNSRSVAGLTLSLSQRLWDVGGLQAPTGPVNQKESLVFQRIKHSEAKVAQIRGEHRWPLWPLWLLWPLWPLWLCELMSGNEKKQHQEGEITTTG